MAVTELNRGRFLMPLSSAALLLLFSAWPLRADRAGDIRTQLSYVATSLAAGNAADAMVPFDKSYVGYDKLTGYFQGLANFQVESEVDVTDEQDTDAETKLTVTWTVTLTDSITNRTDRRTAEINVRLILRSGKWKIIDFSPVEMFNPLPQRAPASK